MAEYILYFDSDEISARYYCNAYNSRLEGYVINETEDSKYTFRIPEIPGAIIKGISITAPVKTTYSNGGYGNFLLKIGNTEIGKWTNKNMQTWAVDNLSIDATAAQTIVLDLEHTEVWHGSSEFGASITGRSLERGQVSLTIEIDNPFVAVSPNGDTFKRSESITAEWLNAMVIDPAIQVIYQRLYWRNKKFIQYDVIELDTDLKTTSYTFSAGTFEEAEYEWYVELKFNTMQVISSNKCSFSVIDDFIVKATSPTDYQKIGITSPIKFGWSNSYIGGSLGVQSQYIVSDGFTKIDVGAKATEYTMTPGTLKPGSYTWYIEATDSTGSVINSNVLHFTITNDLVVNLLAPKNGAEFLRSYGNIHFEWSNSAIGSATPPTSQYFYYRKKGSSGWIEEYLSPIQTTNTYRAGGFDGTYEWRVLSYNSATSTDTWSDIYEFTVTNDFFVEAIAPLDGERIAISANNVFSWSNSIIGGEKLTCESQKIYWKYTDEQTYRIVDVGKDSTSYEFPKNTFNNKTINWYIEAVDNYGHTEKSAIQTILVGVIPEVSISYPSNVNIRSTSQQIFTWEMIEELSTGQKSYELQYKKDSDSQWTVINNNSGNQYHTFDANTFDVGHYSWFIKVTNNDNLSATSSIALFQVIGETEAPNITSVSNSSIPTISWEITNQDTFEMEIYDSTGHIYSSGVQAGYNVRQFTPNIMLPDGNYIIKMRAMNEYGYFTEWIDYSFVLNTEKPNALDCIVYANPYHGVDVVIAGGNIEEVYVIRRIKGKNNWSILTHLKGNSYTDNTIISGVRYEYALRNYKIGAGYTDSNIVPMVIEYKGHLIYEGNAYVELYKTESEQFEISHMPSKVYSYSFMVGRKYPIRETSDYISHNTNLSCFVKFEDYKKLEEFYDNSGELWYKDNDFSYKCAIDSISIQETLLSKGYSITLSLSRVDEGEVILIE